MLQRRRQYSYITSWIATNGEVEEGVLSEDSHSSAMDDFLVVISGVFHMLLSLPFIATEGDFNYIDNTVPLGQLCLQLHRLLQ
jgi:hypothetical protein